MRLDYFVLVLCVGTVFADDVPWWKTATFYQVYPRSFKDSNGDGVGDLKGILQKAEYFKEIGVDAVWLSPVYTSPMTDFGYDISDFTGIDPIFGTMQDFDALLKRLKNIGIKLMMDFVPNHSSIEHPWFKASVNPSDPHYNDYKDFYVWADPKGTDSQGKPIPPNNWCSLFGGSMWEYREERKQFYLHQFEKAQPDLNYRNPNVVGNITAMLNFWLDKGIDGFRMDAVVQIFEDAQLRDQLPVPGTSGDSYYEQQHTYDKNQPETFQLVKSWANMVYKRVQRDKSPRLIFLEVYEPIDLSMKYYGTGNESLEFPFFFGLAFGNLTIQPAGLKSFIDPYIAAISADKDRVANWVTGNHDIRRAATCYGPEMADSINMLSAVLPGIKILYYGEEIGMTNTFIRYDQTKDPRGINLGPLHYQEGSRDPQRTPMQWDNTLSAGFSNVTNTWLPVNPNYWMLNVAAQRIAPESHLKVFQALMKARKDPVLKQGGLRVVVPSGNTDTLLVVRTLNNSYYALIINMGSIPTTYTPTGFFGPQGINLDHTVVVSSDNVGYNPGYHFGKNSTTITLRPKGAILLKTSSSTSLQLSIITLLCSLIISKSLY